MPRRGAPVNDRRRIDLYLSAASAPRAPVDADAVARAVFEAVERRASSTGRKPSLFYAPLSVEESYDESLDAVLQTRGAGVAMFLLTIAFFQDKRCVLELLQFLDIRARAEHGQDSKIRFVCFDSSPDHFLQDPRVQPYAHLFSGFRLHSIDVSTREAMTFDIVNLVFDAWLQKQRPSVLGETFGDTVADLILFFNEESDLSPAKMAFHVEDPAAKQLWDVFVKALSSYSIGAGFDIAPLHDIVTRGDGLHSEAKRAAVEAFDRKWMKAGAWSWAPERDRLKDISLPPVVSHGAPSETKPHPVADPADSHGPALVPKAIANPLEVELEDVFSASFMVPSNPPGVVLCYDDIGTMEGQLKSLVLCQDSHNCGCSIAAVARGMGGAGKTCALRGLASLREVRHHFRDGAYFVSLGKQASVPKVITALAELVHLSGGLKTESKIRACDSIESALEIVLLRFRGKRCLFIIDDVWGTATSRTGLLKDLANIADSGDGSRLVFSTRDHKIALTAASLIVSFKPRDKALSRHILLQYAGFQACDFQAMSAAAREALSKALKRCAGLPIALAVTGRLVYWYAQQYENKGDAWIHYANRATQEHMLRADSDYHPGLYAALSQSLAEMEARLQQNNWDCRYSAAEMFRALSVLKKQDFAPSSLLGALWGLESTAVEIVAEEFASLSLVEAVRSTEPAMQVFGIRLHDLALDFCRMEASSKDAAHGGCAKWHTTLLDGYLPPDRERNWWCVPDDGYLFKNLTRHMLQTKSQTYQREATALLLEYRWIMIQLKNNGFPCVLQDFEVIRTFMKEDEARFVELPAIELISSTLRMALGSVCINAQSLAFQLVGRLGRFKAENEGIAQLLCSVIEHAPSPWLRPLWPCLNAPNLALQISCSMGSQVSAIAWIPQSTRVVAAAMNGLLRVLDTETGLIEHVLEGHKGAVLCVAVYSSGATAVVVSGGEDGTLRFWDAQNGIPKGQKICASTDWIQAVAVSRNGEFVVSASNRGKVWRWKTETRKKAGKLVDNGFRFRKKLGHVCALAISVDGRKVAAGTKTGEVWIWDMGQEGLGKVASAVKLGAHDHLVRTIVMSTDGRTVVSGSEGLGSILVWSVLEERQVGQPIVTPDSVLSLSIIDRNQIWCGLSGGDVHLYDLRSGNRIRQLRAAHSGDVLGLHASADGSRLMSGGGDGLVRIWDLTRNSKWVGGGEGIALQGRESAVRCIAASPDQLWVVTGHGGGVVCLWDAAKGEIDGRPLNNHALNVNCVTVSPDSRRVVSGSDDEKVVVWEINSRQKLFELSAPFYRESNRAMSGFTDGRIKSVVVSRDGKRIVAGSGDGTVRVWSMKNGGPVFRSLHGHGSAVDSVAVTPDGTWIITGSLDHSIRIWSMRTGITTIGPVTGHSKGVFSVEVSADNQSLVSRGSDEQVRVLKVVTGECVRTVRRDEPLYHSSVEVLAAPDRICQTDDFSTRLSMSHSVRPGHTGSEQSRIVYKGDPSEKKVVAVFDLDVGARNWLFDSSRQRLWAVLADGSVAIVESN